MRRKINTTPIILGLAALAIIVVIYGNPPWREAVGSVLFRIFNPILTALINFIFSLFSGRPAFS